MLSVVVGDLCCAKLQVLVSLYRHTVSPCSSSKFYGNSDVRIKTLSIFIKLFSLGFWCGLLSNALYSCDVSGAILERRLVKYSPNGSFRECEEEADGNDGKNYDLHDVFLGFLEFYLEDGSKQRSTTVHEYWERMTLDKELYVPVYFVSCQLVGDFIPTVAAFYSWILWEKICSITLMRSAGS